MAVTYTELFNSRRETVERGGSTAYRVLKCDWGDRMTLAKQLLGYVLGGVTYNADIYDSGDDPLADMYATKVDIEPFPKHQYAKLSVYYETKGDLFYITESLESSSEFLTLQNAELYWDTGADPADELLDTEMIGKLIPRIDWVFTIHNFPYIPDAVFESVGKVNQCAQYSTTLDLWWPAETLLCGTPVCDRSIDPEGTSSWEITHRFTYQNNGTWASPKGWNYFPDIRYAGTDIAYGYVYDASSNAKIIYPLGNFSTIII